jgi:hypothetical protein
MSAQSITNLLGAIVTVALVTTIVSRGSQAATVIRAAGDAFGSSLRAATGR